MERRRFVIFFFAVAFVMIEASGAEIFVKNMASFECLAAYAKLQGIKMKNIDEVEYDSSNSECVSARQNLISKVRTEIRSKISEVKEIMEIPKYQNCVYEKMTGSESFVHSIITAAAFEYLDEFKGKNLLTDAIAKIMEKLNESFLLCQQQEELHREFQKIYAIANEEGKKLSAHEDYCIKKYLIKNNIIDILFYDIELNPQNVNVTGLNCEEMIRKLNEKIYDQLELTFPNLSNDEKIECVTEKFREADYSDLMMKITALTTLNITDEQKKRERGMFVEILSNVFSRIATC